MQLVDRKADWQLEHQVWYLEWSVGGSAPGDTPGPDEDASPATEREAASGRHGRFQP